MRTKNTFIWALLFALPVIVLALIGSPTDFVLGLTPETFIGIMGATLGAGATTIVDLAKRTDPSGKIATIIEMLAQKNGILEDMHYEEGNLPTGHRSTIRTGLPTVYWRLLNQGTPPSKSTTAQVDDVTGMLESWIEVDEELVNLASDQRAFRLSEAAAHMEALSQEMAQTVFYGNQGTAPEEFTGLSVRYSSLSAANAQNIVNGGGSGSDNTSIWLIRWGQGVHGIVPRGSQAGLKHEDLGKVTVEVTAGIAGNRMRAYQDHFIWKNGLVVRDWRDAVRIANIDVSNLVAESSNADLLKLMLKATYRLVNGTQGAVFYMNRTAGQFLDIQTKAAVSTGGQLSYGTVQGQPVLFFRGIPIRIVDSLIETEAAVT